jgi:multiple sugar transport system ATP-binding protein
VSLGIRPEHIAIANDHDERDVPGDAVLVELVGADILLDVKVADGAYLKVRAPASLRIHEGDRIRLRVRAEDVHLFETGGTRIAPSRDRAEINQAAP